MSDHKVFGLVTLLLIGVSWRALSEPPQGSTEMLSMVREALKERHTEEVLGAVEKYERQYQNDSQALLSLATLMSESSLHQAAAREFARINELRPHSPDILYNLGVAQYNLKRLDEAARVLAEAADLDARPAEIHFSLGLVASENGDRENAIIEFRHALERAPQRADLHYLLGQEYFRLSYWEGAAAAYQRATGLDSRNALYFAGLGETLLATDDYVRATKALEQAAQLDSNFPDINYLIGYAYRNQKKLEMARRYFEQQLTSTPGHVESLANLGFLAVEQDRLADAQDYLRQVLANAPDHTAANFDLGRMWTKSGRDDRAVEVFSRVLLVSPDHTQAQYQLFLCYSRARQPALAQAALSQFKKLEELDKEIRRDQVNLERAQKARYGSSQDGKN
jgi:tetratricopeptide (TPR) repeat protein